LVAAGLVKEVKAKSGAYVWRRDDMNGQAYALKLTPAGLKAIKVEETEAVDAKISPTASGERPKNTADEEKQRRGASRRQWRSPRRGKAQNLRRFRAAGFLLDAMGCQPGTLIAHVRSQEGGGKRVQPAADYTWWGDRPWPTRRAPIADVVA
jgi:hypothetical protein